LLSSQNEGLKEERGERAKLKEAYLKEAKIQKYKHNMHQRLSVSGNQ
jgi:hypothetical protein